jgi:uncharacterized protein
VSQKELETLSPRECLELLAQHSVGRLVYQDEMGPVAEPVNYAIVGEDIVLRVEGGRKRQAVTQPLIAFEVDEIDADHKTGWSVIARGVGHELPIDDAAAVLHELRQAGVDPPLPWASGIHNVWLRIAINTLSGRRLEHEASPLVF